jgi:phage replication O-like protein O
LSERTPQVEDGYTRLANALIESLARARLNGRELSVALAVVRLTYGFQKRSDRIAASQLASLTGIPAKKIGPLLTSLEVKHVLVVERRGMGKIPTIGIDKRTTRWPMRDATYPHAGVAQPTPTRGELSAQPTPTRGVQPTPTRGDTKERKKVRQAPPEIESAFDDVTPLLTHAELDRMIDRYPGGVAYTRDEVRAWVVATWPDLLEYRNPRTHKPYAKPKAALANWWKRARRDEVDAAMRAALARRAAAKLAAPIPEIDEVEFDVFVREMRKVGF